MSLGPELQAKLDAALRFRGLAESVGKSFSLDPDLLTALIAQESAGNPTATRREPEWQYFWHARDLADKLGTPLDQEEEFQRTSWGLIQLMGSNFRAEGFLGQGHEIVAEVGLHFGAEYLKSLTRRWAWGEETDWISAYNQGSPRKTPGGLYLNQKSYVDPVCQYLRELRKLAD